MKACTHNKIRLAKAMAVAVNIAATRTERAIPIQKHYKNIGINITGLHREIGCKRMRAYAIYESMQMQQNASTKAHRSKEIHRSHMDLAVEVSQ